MNDHISFKFSRMLWQIPLVGVLLTMLFLIHYGFHFQSYTLIYIAHGVIMTTGLWLGCQGIVTFLWNKFPWEKTPAKHLIYEIVLILTYTILYSSILLVIERKFKLPIYEEDIFLSAILTILITFFITSIYEASYFYQQWKYNFSKSIRLEKDNIEAKYETLKNQINPHFLFNSLNSLVTVVDDNPKAVDYIQDLSEFLRYGLKSRDKELVLVREEYDMLQKYINLQKQRFGDNLVIENNISEKDFHFSLPPLVLQMLVENCIKHNIISKAKPLHISIYNENGYLVISNNLQKKETEHSTGQGIANIVERYKYFTVKQVKVIEDKKVFEVRIPLLKVEL